MSEETKPNNPATPEVVPAQKPKSNVVTMPEEFGYRLLGSFFILLCIGVLALVVVLLNTDIALKKMSGMSQELYEYGAKLGFTLDDIVVTGREKTAPEEIRNAINLHRGDNYLAIDIQAIRQRLETLPWVRQAVVKRMFFPNVLQVSLEERNVRSLWQLKDKFYPIDYDGQVISAPYNPTRPLLLIVGEGAPENINELLENISSNTEVLKRVKVANYISRRRWNLVLDDIKEGVTIKLPEENVKQAWKKLLKLEVTKGILKRKLTIIDLRLEDKVTVTLRKTQADSGVKLNTAKETKI